MKTSRSLWFRTWLAIGLQSFGGGAATLSMIRRAVVEQHAWVSEEEFTLCWALCLMAPGINLICLSILLGKKVAGWQGAALATAGLMLPSSAVTVLATAGYDHVKDLIVVREALRAVVPAVVGVGLFTAAQMAMPLLRRSREEGPGSLAVSLLLFAGGAAVFCMGRTSVLIILLGCGALGALCRWIRCLPGRQAMAA